MTGQPLNTQDTETNLMSLVLAWRTFLMRNSRGLDLETLDALAKEFISDGFDRNHLRKVENKAKSMSQDARQMFSVLVEKKFAVGQLILFIEEKTDASRIGLYSSWVDSAQLKEQAKEKARDAFENAVLRSESWAVLVALAGTVAVMGTSALGSALHMTEVVQTSQELGSWLQNNGAYWAHVLASDGAPVLSWVAATIAMLGVAKEAVASALKSDAGKKASRDLMDRVWSSFSQKNEVVVQGNLVSQESALSLLGSIPEWKQCLLTHLSARELVLFLGSTEENRVRLMLSNPPSFSQQCSAVCAREPGFVRRVARVLDQSGARWNGDANAVHHVSVKVFLEERRALAKQSPVKTTSSQPTSGV